SRKSGKIWSQSRSRSCLSRGSKEGCWHESLDSDRRSSGSATAGNETPLSLHSAEDANHPRRRRLDLRIRGLVNLRPAATVLAFAIFSRRKPVSDPVKIHN